MKKNLTSLAAVFMIVVMLFEMIPISVLAEEVVKQTSVEWKLPEDQVRLVSFGDSTSNGYWLEGYDHEYTGIGSAAAPESYPVRLYHDLEMIYGEENVIFSQYCINMTRWNELVYCLEHYCGFDETFADAVALSTTSWYGELFYYAVEDGLKYLGDPEVYTGLSEDEIYPAAFADSIKNADIMTLDLGMDGFGPYLSMRILDDMTGYGSEARSASKYTDNLISIRNEILQRFPNDSEHSTDPNQVMAALRRLEASILDGLGDFSPLVAQFNAYFNTYLNNTYQTSGVTYVNLTSLYELFVFVDSVDLMMGGNDTATVKSIYEQMYAGLYDSGNGFINWLFFDLIEGLTYSLGGTILDYDKAMDYIYQLNPDCMVIVNGLYNGLYGMTIDLSETESVPFGDILGIFASAVNSFYAGQEGAVAANHYIDKMRYCEITADGYLESWTETIAEFDDDPLGDYANCDQTTLKLMVDILYGLTDNAEEFGDSDEIGLAIGASLYQGILDAVYDQVVNDETLAEYSEYIDEEDRIELAETAVANTKASLKKYIFDNEDRTYLTAADIKTAYAKNTLSEFSMDVDFATIIRDNLFALGFGGKLDLSSVTDAFSEEENAYFMVASSFETIRPNMQKAAAYTVIDAQSIIAAISGDTDELMDTVGTAFVDFDNATSGAKSIAQLMIRATSVSGVGSHPSPSGTKQKYTAVKSCMPKADGQELLIKYQYTDGTEAADEFTVTLKEGREYSIESPVINNYTADITLVSGVMGTEPVEVTVTYYSSSELPDFVVTLISGIGEVTYTEESYAKISRARTLYDSLTSSQKRTTSVKNSLTTLTDAETSFSTLEAAQGVLYEVMISSRKTGGSAPVANLTGGGEYYTIRGGDITAPTDLSGLTFVGWYTGFSESSVGTLVGNEATLHIKPSENMALTAVYAPKADASYSLTVNAAAYGVAVSGAKQSFTTSEAKTLAAGTEATISFEEEGKEVLLWKDGSNVTYGSSNNLKIVMTQDITLNAIAIPEGKRSEYAYVTVVYKNSSSSSSSSSATVVSRTLYSTSDTITLASTITVNNSSRSVTWDMTEAQIKELMATQNEITVTATRSSSSRQDID